MLLGNKNKCILELKDRENKLLKRYYNKVNENISTVDKYIKKKQRQFLEFFSNIHGQFSNLSTKFETLFFNNPNMKFSKDDRIKAKFDFS
jgi:hypothetical protein